MPTPTRCAAVDNCPADANADQADLDNDGIGNVCDTVDVQGSLLLSRLVIKAANANGGLGRVSASGMVIDALAGTLITSLVNGGNASDVSVTMTAGAFSTTMALGTCTATDGRITCRNDEAGVSASFSRVIQGDNQVPDAYKFTIRQRQVASTGTPAASELVPATVSLLEPTPSITRLDGISSCVAKPGHLRCRED